VWGILFFYQWLDLCYQVCYNIFGQKASKLFHRKGAQNEENNLQQILSLRCRDFAKTGNAKWYTGKGGRQMSIFKTLLITCIVVILFGLIGCIEINDNDSVENFIGSYNVTGTESVGGESSQITDTVKIKNGLTFDLSISTQNFGTLNATVTGDESFVINKQNTNVKVEGESVQITIQASGTVVDDFLKLSGSYSFSGETVTFQLSGSKV